MDARTDEAAWTLVVLYFHDGCALYQWSKSLVMLTWIVTYFQLTGRPGIIQSSHWVVRAKAASRSTLRWGRQSTQSSLSVLFAHMGIAIT